MADNASIQAVNELNKEIRSLKQRLNQLNDQKEALFSQKEQISTQIRTLIVEVKSSKEKRNTLTDEVKDSKKQREALHKGLREKVGSLKELQQQTPRGSYEQSPGQLQREIDRLDERIETTVMSFDQEKKLMKEIKELKKLYNEQKEQTKGWEQTHSLSKDVSKQRKKADAVHKVIQQKAKESNWGLARPSHRW